MILMLKCTGWGHCEGLSLCYTQWSGVGEVREFKGDKVGNHRPKSRSRNLCARNAFVKDHQSTPHRPLSGY